MNLVLKRLNPFFALSLLVLAGFSPVYGQSGGVHAVAFPPTVTGINVSGTGTTTSGTGTTTTGTNTPIFLTSTSTTGPYPYYAGEYVNIPVGKTMVVPIALSGSGPMTYTATSSSTGISPVIKTGYPVLKIHVMYSGTAALSGTMPELNTLHAFTGGTDGGMPYAGLATGSGGSLYGTTEADGSSGFGTVFETSTSGSLTTLYSFSGGADGGNPYGALATGTDGNFYGTTGTGGAGFGTVFKVSTSGSLTTLHAFTDGTDGGSPYAGLITGTDGNFYGTTKTGGNGGGTVFKITPAGALTTLYAFTSGGGADGAAPEAPLLLGQTGKFYGTTTAGGAGFGTVFQITASGSFSTLYTFTGGADGGAPYAGLINGGSGNVYGTTETSGTGGYGTVFSLTTTGTLTTLYSFTGGPDGGNPFASVMRGANGDLYGTTATDGAGGYGTLFELVTTGSNVGTLNVIHSFTGGSDGGNPYSGLVSGNGGYFYGTTRSGTSGYGTVYQAYLPTTGTDAFSGTMTFALLRDMAPTTAGYIAGFAEAGYYNGNGFFRITNLAPGGVQPTYIAQGGDPTNTGTGNPGFAYDNEFKPSLIFAGVGQLAMANSGINSSTYKGTNGTQFFITQGPLRSLDFGYTIFGQLVTGFDVMQHVMGVALQSDGSTPVAKVVMDSVTVAEDNNDAVLLLSAPGYVPNGATITVNAKDPAGDKALSVALSGTSFNTGLSLTVATPNVDSINDPPIINPVAPVNVALHKSVSLPVKVQDLEFDYLQTNAVELNASAAASVSMKGNTAIVTPSSYSPLGSVLVGMNVYQPYTPVERPSPYDETSVTVGLGAGNLTPLPGRFASAPNNPLGSSTSTVPMPAFDYGSFISSNPSESGSNFTATINWGDGSVLSGTGYVSVVQGSPLPTEYSIYDATAHIYSNPGIYPLNVTVTDTNGATLQIQNTAVVTSSNIYAYGRTFTAPKGVANGLIATFVDHSANVTAADYAVTINWGDGSVTTGTGTRMVRGANGYFSVYGTHKYTAGTTYPVDVTINSSTGLHSSGYAWSVANLTGVNTRQPPYAQSHINGQIGDPGYNGLDLDEEVTLVNSGDIASGPVTLQFYLSPTSATEPIDSSAILLSVGSGSTYNTPSIPAGSAIEGSVSNILLPSNVISQGKYIIMKVITSDPIGNHMSYPRAFADPYPLIE